MRGIHWSQVDSPHNGPVIPCFDDRWPVDSLHKGPVRQKMFHAISPSWVSDDITIHVQDCWVNSLHSQLSPFCRIITTLFIYIITFSKAASFKVEHDSSDFTHTFKKVKMLLIEILTHLPWAIWFHRQFFKCIFLNEKFCILIKISLKFVLMGPIDNNLALV